MVKEDLENEWLIGQLLEGSVNDILYVQLTSQTELDEDQDKPEVDEEDVDRFVKAVETENGVLK
jgi:hypothetical protein